MVVVLHEILLCVGFTAYQDVMKFQTKRLFSCNSIRFLLLGAGRPLKVPPFDAAATLQAGSGGFVTYIASAALKAFGY